MCAAGHSCRLGDTLALHDDHALLDVQVEASAAHTIEIYEPTGQLVLSGAPGQHRIDQPALWSPESPALYTCRVLTEGGDGIERRFGIRTACIDDERGLMVNGLVDKFKGFCLHEDAGSLGAAVPEKFGV